MKRFNRLIFSLVLLLVATFTLAACGGETDQEKLDAVVDNIEIFLATGDTTAAVTSNITLPTTVGEYEISWTSSKTDVISNAGVVTRPEVDTAVTLTAKITLNEASAEATFTVTVLADDTVDPQDVLDAIVITGEGVTAPSGSVTYYVATGDLTLPASGQGLTITWTSGTPAVIANDGTVTRPLKDDGNAMVILTATVEGVEAQFAVQVPELAEYTDTQKLDRAYPTLLVTGSDAGVVTGQEVGLATVVGVDGVTVTWESSEPTVIYPNGLVVRPELGSEDVDVTLTATLHSGDETRTKVFEFVVKARTVQADVSGTIAAMLAEDLDTYVRLNDVTIMGQADDGLFVQDATGTAFIYGGSMGTKYEVGDVVNIEGFVAHYYGALQITGTDDEPIYMVPSTGTATTITYEDSTVGAINALTLPNITTNPFNVMAIHIEAVVTIVGEGNYSVFLVPADHIGAFDSHNAIMIYYKSNIGAIRELAGKKIAVDLLVIGYRTDKVVWYADFIGEAEDLQEVPLTDSESVTIANAGLSSLFKEEYVLEETFTLPTDVNGVAVEWDTESTLFNLETGVLSMPASGNENVTLTAVLSKGDEVQNFSVTFKAGEIAVLDIIDVLDVDNGYYVHVVGEVIANEYYNTFFVQDATGGIAIYTGGDDDLTTFLTTNYGKVVDIVGLRAAYRGMNQISDVAIYSLVGDPTTAVTPLDVTDAHLDADTLLADQGKLVVMNGLIVTDVSDDSHDNIYVTLFDTTSLLEVTMKWDSRVDLSEAQATLLAGLAVGDTVNVTTALAWSDGPYLYFTDSTDIVDVPKTDAEMKDLAISLLENVVYEDQYVEATTLDLPATLVGATVTYASDSAYLDESTGELTLPDLYRELVTITATVTYGSESGTATIEFYVGVLTIEDARALPEETEVTLRGVITAENNGVFYLQDDTAAIQIYNHYTATDAIAFYHANVGKVVEVTGLVDINYGMVRITDHTYVALADETYEVVATDIAALDWSDNEVMTPYQSVWASLDHMMITDIYTSGSGNVSFYLTRTSDGAELLLYYNSYDTLTTEQQAVFDALAINDVIDIEAVVGWYNNAQLLFTNQAIITEVAANDDDLVYMDSLDITVPTTVTEATTLTLPASGTNGSGITWESTNEAIINSTTGEVALPAETTEVTLTATLTINTSTLEVQFVVNVVSPTSENASDLFISEYIEGGSYNKAVEIFNGTGNSVDLSVYSVALYTSASATVSNEIALTGTLADGEVFVVSRSDAAAGIVSVTDLIDTAKSTINWNGDDAVALLKNGVIIDIVGFNDGTDPGTQWTWTAAGGDGATGTTLDRTLVRKAGTTGPSATFDSAQWDVYAKDTLTYIGSHVA